MKKTTIKTFSLMLFISIFLSGCFQPPPMATLQTQIEFEGPNIIGDVSELITPFPGIHDYLQGTSATFFASDSENYRFIRWAITPNNVDANTYYVPSREYIFNIVKNKNVTAFYGCKTDLACEEGYTCQPDATCR